MEWISVKDGLPDEDVAVWLRLDNGPGGHLMIVGCLSYVGDPGGWVWCNSYGNFWWTAGKGWECDGEADDDYNPTDWGYLPDPPKKES